MGDDDMDWFDMFEGGTAVEDDRPKASTSANTLGGSTVPKTFGLVRPFESRRE